jgi:hypothetical protein
MDSVLDKKKIFQLRRICITLVPDWQQAPKEPYASWLFELDAKSLTSQSNKTSKTIATQC